MAVCENSLKVETNNGNRENEPNTSEEMAQRKRHCENGPNTLEEIALTAELSGNMTASETRQLTQAFNPAPVDRSPSTPILARRLKAKWRRKKKICISMTVLSIVSSAVTAFICVTLTKPSCGSCPATTVPPCPSGWVWYEGKCYSFSESEGTWNSSQTNCSASGASLVAIENKKEMDFIMQHKKATDYWIGLKRKKGQPWEWPNGTVFDGWFEIGADGPCAYLNDEKASSTLCGTRRNWICSMSPHVA